MKNKKSMKFLKVMFIILIVFILLLLIHTLRNFIIILDLQDKIAEYTDSKNYHIKSVADQNNGVIVTMNYYQKDNNQVCFLERNSNGEITKILMYNNGERTNIYTETLNSKTANLNSGGLMSVQVYNTLQTDNMWQTFLYSVLARITTVEYNNKECYCINDFLTPYAMYGTEKNEVYIDKETGLMIRNNIDNLITEREYEFDNVDDAIFVEPDISEYTLEEN